MVDRLAAALAGRRVVICSRGFDVGRLRYGLARYYAGRVADRDAQGTAGRSDRGGDVGVSGAGGGLDGRDAVRGRTRGLKHVVDGRLGRAVSLHGFYRLPPETAGELAHVAGSTVS